MTILAVLLAPPCAAEEHGFRLIAHAVDANAAVFRLSDGSQARVRVGQAIDKSDVVLERVTDVGVVLRARDNLNGQPLRWSLRDNESVSQRQFEVLRESRLPQPTQPVVVQPAAVPKTSKKR